MDRSTLVKEASQELLHNGKYPPTVLIQFAEHAIPIRRTLRPFPATAEQRQQVLYQEGKFLGQSYPTWTIQQVWFVCEAWVSTNLRMAASQDPKRREVLLVIGLDGTSPEDPALRQQGEVLEMRRNKHKKITSLSPLPELVTASEPVTPAGVLPLAFLAGFVDATAPTHPFSQYLREQIAREQLRMRILIEEHTQ